MLTVRGRRSHLSRGTSSLFVCSFVVSSRPLPCREAVQAAFRKPGTHHTSQDPAFRGITTIPVIGKQHKWVWAAKGERPNDNTQSPLERPPPPPPPQGMFPLGQDSSLKYTGPRCVGRCVEERLINSHVGKASKLPLFLVGQPCKCWSALGPAGGLHLYLPSSCGRRTCYTMDTMSSHCPNRMVS